MIKEKFVLIDDDILTPLKKFIKDNTKKDVEPFTSNEISQLNELKVNDYIYLGMFFKVRRVV